MVMPLETVPKCLNTNDKCNANHTPFKSPVMYNIDAKKRDSSKHKGKQSAMNGTSQRSANTQSVPIYLHKIKLKQAVLKANYCNNVAKITVST